MRKAGVWYDCLMYDAEKNYFICPGNTFYLKYYFYPLILVLISNLCSFYLLAENTPFYLGWQKNNVIIVTFLTIK
jgi:hypothetical protein